MRKIALSILFFLIPILAHSETLDKDAKNEDIMDFSGGLNTNTIPSKLKKNESPNMSNVIIDDHDGRINTVGGYKVIGSTPTLSKINFIYEFKDVNNIKTYVISDSQKVLSTKDFQSYTLLIDSLNANALISAVEVEYKLWMTNGQNSVFTYDGSTVVILDGRFQGFQTPNVPKGKYINYYQGRIWIYNNPNNTSALYFTDLVSTNNVSISPDNYLAWNPENQLNVGYGDGQNGTAIWTYRGQQFAGKDHSIYTIAGNDKYSYQWIKTDSKIGVAGQDSLDILDNYTYIKAKNDGIYIFNGNTAERITDPIEPNMDEISANDTRLINSVWETDSDFSKGLVSGTTVSMNMVSIQTSTIINYERKDTPVATYHLTASSTVDTPYTRITSNFIDGSNRFDGLLKSFSANARSYNGGCGGSGNYQTVTYYLKNTRLDIEAGKNVVIFATNTSVFGNIIPMVSAFSLTIDDILNGNFVYRLSLAKTNCTGDAEVMVSSLGVLGESDILMSNTTGSYYSSVDTITTITSWDSFNSVNNINNGSIQFFYRTSSTVSGLSNNSWNPISEGAVINSSTTDKFIQWSATITANEGNIDNVTIAHNEGGLNDSRPVMNHWKNRLWVAVSTDSIGTIIYVKSKNTNSNPNAWMRIDGINIKSMLNNGEYFYAGSSTAGVILRLDFGTNFNGSVINSYYETPDLDFGNPFFKKDILKYYFDTEKQSGKTLRIGTSKDGGNWSYNDIDCSGSGRLLRQLNAVPYKDGKYFRFRFENNDLDRNLDFNNFSVIYKNTQRD